MFKRLIELCRSREKTPAVILASNQNEVWICKEDMEHHCKFVGTGSFAEDRNTPTPIEVFEMTAQFGVVPPDYLDRFTPASYWYEEIQKYKQKYGLA
jgi:hypothetical protein